MGSELIPINNEAASAIYTSTSVALYDHLRSQGIDTNNVFEIMQQVYAQLFCSGKDCSSFNRICLYLACATAYISDIYDISYVNKLKKKLTEPDNVYSYFLSEDESQVLFKSILQYVSVQGASKKAYKDIRTSILTYKFYRVTPLFAIIILLLTVFMLCLGIMGSKKPSDHMISQTTSYIGSLPSPSITPTLTGKATLSLTPDITAISSPTPDITANLSPTPDITVAPSPHITATTLPTFTPTPFIATLAPTVAITPVATAVSTSSPAADTSPFVIEDGKLIKYVGTDTHVTIPDGVSVVCQESFLESNVEYIYIPDSVTTVENRAFTKCAELRYIRYSNNMTQIIDCVYINDRLEEVVLPSNLSYISAGSITEGGTNRYMKSITIPSSVFQIYNYAFIYLYELTEILVEEGSELFISVDGVLYSADKRTLLYVPINYNAKEYHILDGTVEVADLALTSNRNIENLIIPSSVKILPKQFLGSMSRLRNVYFYGNIEYSEISSFANGNSSLNTYIYRGFKFEDDLRKRGYNIIYMD